MASSRPVDVSLATPPRIRRRLWDATGRFIADFAKWHTYATLTFDGHVSRELVLRNLRSWFRQLAQDVVGCHMAAAVAVERGGELLHAHVLLGPERNADLLEPGLLNFLWLTDHGANGFSRLKRYDSSRGAAWYLQKDGDWFVGIICPREPRCRRKNGCLVGPPPW